MRTSKSLLTLAVVFLSANALADDWLSDLFGQGGREPAPSGDDSPCDGPCSPIPGDYGEPFGVHQRMQLDYLVAAANVGELAVQGTLLQFQLYGDDQCGELIWTGYAYAWDPGVIVHDLNRYLVDPKGQAVPAAEIRTIFDVITPEPVDAAFLRVTADGLTPVVATCQPQRLSAIPFPKPPPPPQGAAIATVGDEVEGIVTQEEYSEDLDLGPADQRLCFLTKTTFDSGFNHADKEKLFTMCDVNVLQDGHWHLVSRVDAGDGAQVRCSARCLDLVPADATQDGVWLGLP